MASYIFSSPSFLNSTLYSPPLGTNYHICTTSSSLGRQHTFVTPESDAHAAHGAPSGVIHWDLLAFEIDGERKCIVPDLRTDVEPSGEIPVTGMRSCRWCWDRHGEFESEHETKLRGTQIFVVTWLNDQWIATSEKSKSLNVPSAVFTPPRTVPHSVESDLSPTISDETPFIVFGEDVSVKDMVFLIMVMIFSQVECFMPTEETPGLA